MKETIDEFINLSIKETRVNPVGNGSNVSEDIVDGPCLGRMKKSVSEDSDEDNMEKLDSLSEELYVRIPVDINFSHYKMDHKHRGLALIFNHEAFDNPRMNSRRGTNKDRDDLKLCLIKLGFAVQVFQDLNYSDIESHIKQIAQVDHSNHDCFLITVLSHGKTGFLHAKDKSYMPDRLWELFTDEMCPTLADKPKIFFLQACQGVKFDDGVTLVRTETDGEVFTSFRVPSQRDFLVVYSTAKGHYSWRNTTSGSWFIQSLCKELNERAYNLDLATILTIVSQRVALQYQSETDKITYDRKKQIPCVVNMLRRLIQFTPKDEGTSSPNGSL